MDLIQDYVNLCSQKSLVSESICRDIINPIFKEGTKSNPENYRGNCISSVILKLITSIIYERMQSKADEIKLINKNQIGFKRNSRTSDHLLTLKTIIKKYVTIGGKKMSACFVDLKKAFDSVWHNALFEKIKKIGLHGKLLSLVKNIYSNTSAVL